MPTTRRSASSNLARSGPAKGQSTISFSNKVTKSVPRAQQNKGIAAPSVAKAEPIEKPSPAPPSEVHVVDEPKAELAENHEPQAERQAQEPVKSEAQVQAGKLSEADISKYWRDIESRRVAPRVHQDDLSLSEKILRYFDVSSQYGPCVGMSRMKRWQRAERLGLNPPLEVLAVLLAEDSKGSIGFETAHMDQILNPTAVSA